MAIPENWESIVTNLPLPRLKAFLDALDANKVAGVPDSTSMYAESAACEFDFEGARYEMSEYFENVDSVYLKSGSPAFVNTLIDELEAELAGVVKKRDYDAAKAVNEKIEYLKKFVLGASNHAESAAR